MSGNSEYLSTYIANWIRGTNMTGAPTTLYIGLATAAVTGLTAPTEPAGGSYARETITFSAPNFTDVDGAVITSSADVVFTTATGSWGAISHGFISDSLSGGNVLEKWAWPVTKTINTSDTYVVATGDVTLAF
jgi:hypothetical protein